MEETTTREKNAQKRTKYHGNVEFFPITRYLLL
nr:MAG TPA: hypothetical protein [Caudoviricetes sp.]